MRLPTTTMVATFEGKPSLDEEALGHLLRGEWFLQDPSIPACGVVRYVRPEETNDGMERIFVCDLPDGHHEDRHRQVTDVAGGTIITWSAAAHENA